MAILVCLNIAKNVNKKTLEMSITTYLLKTPKVKLQYLYVCSIIYAVSFRLCSASLKLSTCC